MASGAFDHRMNLAVSTHYFSSLKRWLWILVLLGELLWSKEVGFKWNFKVIRSLQVLLICIHDRLPTIAFFRRTCVRQGYWVWLWLWMALRLFYHRVDLATVSTCCSFYIKTAINIRFVRRTLMHQGSTLWPMYKWIKIVLSLYDLDIVSTYCSFTLTTWCQYSIYQHDSFAPCNPLMNDIHLTWPACGIVAFGYVGKKSKCLCCYLILRSLSVEHLGLYSWQRQDIEYKKGIVHCVTGMYGIRSTREESSINRSFNEPAPA